MDGYCWFPFVDSCDWSSVLVRSEGHIDPVGVYWLGRTARPPAVVDVGRLRPGPPRCSPSSELTAYRFQPPVDRWLAGWLPQMDHWDWQDPPALEVVVRGR